MSTKITEIGREWLDNQARIKELRAEAAEIGKDNKNLEAKIFNSMVQEGIEDVDVDGVKITRKQGVTVGKKK